MSYYLPLFPLNLVAFPQEELNLHIFEPRYRDLVNDCWKSGENFGIPSYVCSKIEYGTEMKILEISKTYQDGRMDIKTLGHTVFKVTEFTNPWPGKEYAGGEVELLEQVWDQTSSKLELLDLLDQLYGKLDIEKEISYHLETPVFKLAHKVGLDKEQEYQLLQISHESLRIEYLISHIKNLLPKLKQAESIRDRIKMNGHFKQLDSLDF